MNLVTLLFCSISLLINSPVPVISQFWRDHGTKPATNGDSIKTQLSCTVPTDAFLRMIDTSTNTILRVGTMVNTEVFVMYACLNSVLIGEQKTNFCHDNYWIYEHPRCILKMCLPIVGHTITARCTYKEKVVPCNRIASPGTIAEISCAVMYENPSTQHKELHCQDNGEWNYTPFECEQVCGKIDKNMTERGSKVHKVPWQVALYSLNNIYKHICDGTLIKSKIVISAAHCVWNYSTNTKYNPSNFVIVVGKFYRYYYAKEDLMIQESNISKIDVPTDFGGHTNIYYLSDIAILTLTDHIEFTDYIRPACLIWKTNNEKVMQNNKLGITAGWGKTYTGTYSTELRSVELLSIDYQSCAQIIPTNAKRISDDKFCGKNTEDSYICQGGGGGGFLVAEDINNYTYYHLWGIFSYALLNKDTFKIVCDANSSIAFTNIQYYKDLVSKAISDAYAKIHVS